MVLEQIHFLFIHSDKTSQSKSLGCTQSQGAGKCIQLCWWGEVPSQKAKGIAVPSVQMGWSLLARCVLALHLPLPPERHLPPPSAQSSSSALLPVAPPAHKTGPGGGRAPSKHLSEDGDTAPKLSTLSQGLNQVRDMNNASRITIAL